MQRGCYCCCCWPVVVVVEQWWTKTRRKSPLFTVFVSLCECAREKTYVACYEEEREREGGKGWKSERAGSVWRRDSLPFALPPWSYWSGVLYKRGTEGDERAKKANSNSFLLNRGQKPVMHTHSTQSLSLGKYLDCSFESVWEPLFV